MVRRTIFALLVSLIVLSSAVRVKAQAPSQKTTTSPDTHAASAAVPAHVPTGPKDLMALAAKVNGLAGLDDHKWHLKATYQIFDPDGHPEQSGEFEEWWAGPKKNRTSYSEPDFHQTVYLNGVVRKVSGDHGWPPLQVGMATDFVLNPLPPADFLSQLKYDARNRTTGQVELRCVYPRAVPKRLAKEVEKLSGQFPFGRVTPDTCFGKGMAMIRVLETSDGVGAFFNQVLTAGGHYIPKEVMVQDGSAPIVKLEVVTLEFPVSIPASVFEAPANAFVPLLPSLSAAVVAGRRIGGEEILYPEEAKEQHISGVVLLGAEIDKTGSIADLKVIAGPKLLRDAAVRAVKTWKYKPYLLNGKPVEVRTQVHVVFTLGG